MCVHVLEGFHMDCLDPPIATVPADNWFCYNCLSTSGGDFGFDEGEEHSLSSFQARDLEFRRIWFEKCLSNPEKCKSLPSYMCNEMSGVKYTEYDVEEEFWRLVQSQQETVEIEYGADVHSTTHGRLVRVAFASSDPIYFLLVLCPLSKHILSSHIRAIHGISTTSRFCQNLCFVTSSQRSLG